MAASTTTPCTVHGADAPAHTPAPIDFAGNFCCPPPFTDLHHLAGITARRSWSADPATDPYAYLLDQRCVVCNTQVSDDDRGPFYDSATDDGTAHVCPTPATAPRVVSAEVTTEADGTLLVRGMWEADRPLDRPATTGYALTNRSTAERLRRAMEAGVVFIRPVVKADIYGKTYVACSSTVLGRMASADLRRLGF